eukprot:scaffold249339_cov49-Cyclotella_meneghiniana.AAC.2
MFSLQVDKAATHSLNDNTQKGRIRVERDARVLEHEDIDAIDSDVARLQMRLFAIVLDHNIYAATDPPAVMFNR